MKRWRVYYNGKAKRIIALGNVVYIKSKNRGSYTRTKEVTVVMEISKALSVFTDIHLDEYFRVGTHTNVSHMW